MGEESDPLESQQFPLCSTDGLLLSQSRQRILCLNTLRTVLQVMLTHFTSHSLNALQ